ncbi:MULTISPECIES: flagellar motor switch protein FliN [Pseudoalteromonas]|mgnify:FL=1|jgi:flagellar motor switch protein FliN/FliY|uniref:Flagellar motor switch protein FliN n=1 Tax=Pseudoalteromonas lipolytica TaxID=570156 RepID=A0AAD0WBX2_9GAMM|nr:MULTISPECIES: flagellar motor switch protein FliN [Pseudoalteromonas]AXV64645.1 flagellar motor switch protein FliN [Pseudoalteromonas donghaensis]EWH06119.1 flagellar motor switch protein FliN [Pseudoalteromonas lipolytica SCSIO 04301]MAE02159.1 flagellar motor switch protein FliN [Pseudoalteromonas sp.]MBE0351583.1 flagellar motor switch protein FliN/FliY [Pseudoalteromonas lipolytica LMEB 39]MCC9661873.1 flagellar motor switch protein FliN [Pseudoalteromonas sp. MB41]|tara:strand:- start:3412 stop:3813 length:402 start_codon:yes stop_codon:yes gene_type:complete
MSDDQDTMDEWAAALAEAEEAESATSNASVAELDELKDEKHELSGDEKRKLDTILDIPVTISMEVGRSKINIRNLLQLNQGSVVELDRVAGEPLDVLVNGTLIAHGEVVVVNDKFGIRLTDVISQVERIKKLR